MYVMKISSTNKLPGFRNRIPAMVLLSASVAVMRCMEKRNPLSFRAGISYTCGMDPNMRITHFEQASQFVRRSDREGWGTLKL
jgi:hypothetical protein